MIYTSTKDKPPDEPEGKKNSEIKKGNGWLKTGILAQSTKKRVSNKIKMIGEEESTKKPTGWL